MQLKLLQVQILVSTAAEALVVGRRKPREEGGWWAAEFEQQPQCRTHFGDGDEAMRQELFPDGPIKQNFADISLSLDKQDSHQDEPRQQLASPQQAGMAKNPVAEAEGGSHLAKKHAHSP
jgi:hypothetical protein